MLRCVCAEFAFMSDVELIKRVTESIKSNLIMLQKWIHFFHSAKIGCDRSIEQQQQQKKMK